MHANHHISKPLANERVADLRREAASRADPATTSRRGAGSEARGASGSELVRMLQSAAAGNSGDWELLVDRFAGMIWAIARAHRLSAADAADVSQATWLKLVERLDQIRDPDRVGGWLATTARRECLRVLRGSRREAPSGEDIPQQWSPEAPPDKAVQLTERNQLLWQCFARLRPSDQALLRLLLAEPRPAYEEISAALDMPIGSIGPTRARALKRLRREIEREGELSLMTD
jgi:RNA polymerase sigma factor (sigma-70 family)